MPQLEEGLWIAGGYYIDFDELDQFRIIGPNNELYLGLLDIPRHKIAIKDVVEAPSASVKIIGSFTAPSINLYYPTMDDIRSIRELIQHPDGHKITYLELRRQRPAESSPMYVRHTKKEGLSTLLFQRNYGQHWYHTRWEFPKNISIRDIIHPYKGYKLTAKHGRTIPFTLYADTNDFDEAPCTCRLLPDDALDWSVFGPEGKIYEHFWKRTSLEIKHLVSWRKTSGDRFGTIFPRDWMESIVLGHGDIQQETIDTMLKECLAHVDSEGHGWHEDVVGEYKYEHELAGKDLYDRKMVDIEPLYLICLRYASPDFWKDKKSVAKLQRVAKYVMKKAATKQYITFKKLSKERRTPTNTYYRVGNWRDSAWAYKQIDQIVAPYDVNVAHYPHALSALVQFSKQLKVDVKKARVLENKWQEHAEHYQFSNWKNKQAYALALFGAEKHGQAAKKMEVEHLDEAYRYAFGAGTEKDVAHFAENLLSSDAFFTPSGPMITGRHNTYGYTTAEYHGLVIWAKQVAFAVMGLSVQRKRAVEQSWSKTTSALLDKALETTCKSILKAFHALSAIPELHYDKDGAPHFFTDQAVLSGGMSKVQLWSAIGFRRIIRVYHQFLVQRGFRGKNK